LRFATTSLANQFKKIDLSEYPDVTKYDRALEAGLWVLRVYSDIADREPYLNAVQISEILDGQRISFDEIEITKAFARAGKQVKRKTNGKTSYKLMQKGIEHLEDLAGAGNIHVQYIEGDKPRTARMMPKQVISKTKGEIKIIDPYYGIATLDMLETIYDKRSIKFLSARLGHEDAGRFSRALTIFKKQYKNIELKKSPSNQSFHDRYVLTDDTLVILGHGLKDMGGKESFMIVLKDKISKDIRIQLNAKFNHRWGQSTDIA